MAPGAAENAEKRGHRRHTRAGIRPKGKGREILTPLFYSKVCKPRAMSLGSGDHSLGLI